MRPRSSCNKLLNISYFCTAPQQQRWSLSKTDPPLRQASVGIYHHPDPQHWPLSHHPNLILTVPQLRRQFLHATLRPQQRISHAPSSRISSRKNPFSLNRRPRLWPSLASPSAYTPTTYVSITRPSFMARLPRLQPSCRGLSCRGPWISSVMPQSHHPLAPVY